MENQRTRTCYQIMNSRSLLPLSILDFWSPCSSKTFSPRLRRNKSNLVFNRRFRNYSACDWPAVLFCFVLSWLKKNRAKLCVIKLHLSTLKKLLYSLNRAHVFHLAVRSRVVSVYQAISVDLTPFPYVIKLAILQCICVKFQWRCISLYFVPKRTT